MSAHTPGPWAAFGDEGHCNILAFKDRTTCVASLPGRSKREPDIVLIAAAPELLQMLKDAGQWMDDWACDLNGCDELTRRITALIDKATGAA